MAGPVVSRRTYFFTFLALLALTLTTTLVGFLDLGPFSTVVAVILAACKASLIAIFFMHALFESKVIRVVLAGGVIWVAILISLTVADYVTRQFMIYPANRTPSGSQMPLAGP
jgi:cytochrome c oxidase subunit 4